MDMFGIEEISGKSLDFLKGKNIYLVDTVDRLHSVFESFERLKTPLALDTETCGLSFLHHKVVGFVLSPDPDTSFYFPLNHKVGVNLDEGDFIPCFSKLAETAKFILFHAKFDWKMIFAHYKVDFDILADVQIMAYLLDSDLIESKDGSLKTLSRKYLNIEPLELSDFGTHDFSLIPPEVAYKYACVDTLSTYSLYNLFKPDIEKNRLSTVEAIELGLIKPVGKMEIDGVRVDVDYLNTLSSQMKQRIDALEKHIYEIAGMVFDISSPQQVSNLLFGVLKLEPGRKRVGLDWVEDVSVGAEQLQRLHNDHPVVPCIESYRELYKLYNDFALKLPGVIAEDGRLHSEFNSLGARSGRFTSSGGFGKFGEPIRANLQQLPKSGEFTVSYSISLPDDCGLTPEGEYSEESLDKEYPEWRNYIRGTSQE